MSWDISLSHEHNKIPRILLQIVFCSFIIKPLKDTYLSWLIWHNLELRNQIHLSIFGGLGHGPPLLSLHWPISTEKHGQISSQPMYGVCLEYVWVMQLKEGQWCGRGGDYQAFVLEEARAHLVYFWLIFLSVCLSGVICWFSFLITTLGLCYGCWYGTKGFVNTKCSTYGAEPQTSRFLS